MSRTITCVIIDDEEKDRENLALLLDSYCPNVKIIGEAYDSKSILKLLNQIQPDLVFCDIQLGTISVFDTLNQLKNIDFKIVFVSAYDKYAIKGYQYDAIDYLLKPVDSTRLKEVVNKTVYLKSMALTKKNMINEFQEFYTKIIQSPKISITDTKGVHLVEVKSILFCVSNGNYTTFVLDGDKEIVISKNLKHFEVSLKEYNFVRIHKSYLINLSNIDFVIKEQGGYVVMKNGKSLPVSRSAKKELYSKINLL